MEGRDGGRNILEYLNVGMMVDVVGIGWKDEVKII